MCVTRSRSNSVVVRSRSKISKDLDKRCSDRDLDGVWAKQNPHVKVFSKDPRFVDGFVSDSSSPINS